MNAKECAKISELNNKRLQDKIDKKTLKIVAKINKLIAKISEKGRNFLFYDIYQNINVDLIIEKLQDLGFVVKVFEKEYMAMGVQFFRVVEKDVYRKAIGVCWGDCNADCVEKLEQEFDKDTENNVNDYIR